jgi:protein O-mannosyl-transferase
MARALWTLGIVITILAFLPTLGNGFVNWDDDLNFLSNPAYRGLGPAQLKWMFTTFHLGPYQPLAWLTLGMDYTLWGMDARGYHLTSLLIHAANAALFFWLARRIRLAPAGALFAALLFSIHPQRVESVAWVTERRDVLSGLFFLLAIGLYLRRAGPNRPALAAFAFSLLAKATGVVAPILLLLLDVVPLRRLPPDPRRWFDSRHRAILLEKIPWFALAILCGLVAIVGQRQAGAFKPVESFGIAARLGLAVHAAGFYLLKMILPFGLSPLYELRPDFNPAGPATLAAGAALLIATAACIALRRRWPALLAAWIAYLVLILPLSGLARAGHQLAADRYTYLATMPFALLAGAGLDRLLQRSGRVTTGAAAALLLCLGGLTFAQCHVWRDPASLWGRALEVDPRSEKAAVNLASARVDQKRFGDAESIYRDLLTHNPRLVDARYSLGMVLLLQARPADAEQEFRRLIAEEPAFPMGHYGLGILLLRRGQLGAARVELEEALRLKPGLALARRALEEIGAR